MKILSKVLLSASILAISTVGMTAHAQNSDVQSAAGFKSDAKASSSNSIDFASRSVRDGLKEEIWLNLGSSQTVSDIQIAWSEGADTAYPFDIAVRSETSGDWTIIFAGQSDGGANDFETYNLNDIAAREIRIRGLQDGDSNIEAVKLNAPQQASPSFAPVFGRGSNGFNAPASAPSAPALVTVQPSAVNIEASAPTPQPSSAVPATVSAPVTVTSSNETVNTSVNATADVAANVRSNYIDNANRDNASFDQLTALGNLPNRGENVNVNVAEQVAAAQAAADQAVTEQTEVEQTEDMLNPVVSDDVQAVSSAISTQLTHGGEPIILNGANVAWVNFGDDVGFFESSAEQYRNRFRAIKDAGGNSARIWLHASGWISPAIQPDGFVTGISGRLEQGVTDSQVNLQVVDILDVAREEGIILNIALFSYDMMCDEANVFGGQVYRGSRFNKMMTNIDNVNSYINNVLEPLVRATANHPALFSWEIFNEGDGMTEGQDFFADNCPLGGFAQSLSDLQRFVNLSAAGIREIDPDVKITTSVSQTRFLDQYTNETLTSLETSDPKGILDYYQAHWYHQFRHTSNPYIIRAEERGLDQPIVLGEFGEGLEPETGTPPSQIGNALLEQGYAGAWIWSQVTLEGTGIVEEVISEASAFSPPINFND